MGSKESGQVAKIGYIQKIRKALLSDTKGLEQIIKDTELPRRYVSKFLKELKQNNEVSRKVDEKTGLIVWELTDKGKVTYIRGWTALQEDILEIIKRKGSYFRHSDQPMWPTQQPLAQPYVILDDATYPSSLETKLNTIKLQYETKDFLKAKLLKAIADTNEDLPPDAKLILAFQFDLTKYSQFIKGIKRFISDIKLGRDIFSDPNLEFVAHEYYRLELLEAYLDNSDTFSDDGYKEMLKMLLRNENFISTLMSFGMWRDFLDRNVLERLDELFKLKKDPLEDKKLVKKLIIMAPEGGFFVPLYDYLVILRILNHYDNEIKTRLLQYEDENRNRPDKSRVQRIENEMRGHRK